MIFLRRDDPPSVHRSDEIIYLTFIEDDHDDDLVDVIDEYCTVIFFIIVDIVFHICVFT